MRVLPPGESIGMLQVNVSVISPPVGEELFATVDLVVQSVAITASKCDYYIIV